jgi:hypothetical protein
MHVIESIVVIAMIFVGADLIMSLFRDPRVLRNRAAAKKKQAVRDMMRKENVRREKEASAYKGFFEESFIPGFDSNGAFRYRGVRVNTKEALEYYREMNELIDAPIFENTKDL